MEFKPDSKTGSQPVSKDESGVALFMVISAVTMLSILATEFTYVAQVNQRMAFDSLDQVKALALAKTGYKLSLLRLKAYREVKALVSGNGGAKGMVPRSMVDKIWNFPFFFPPPADLPGLSMTQRDSIEKFVKESSLEGKFSSIIESEGARYNINQILSQFWVSAPVTPPPSGNGNANNNSNNSSNGGGNSAANNPPPATFDGEKAREGLRDYLTEIFANETKKNEDFADTYRDIRVDEIVDGIAAYADPSYQKKFNVGREPVPLKQGPFYSVQELRNIAELDDGLYDLIAPNMTATYTPGINVNTMTEPTFRALIPNMVDEEVKAFFEARDSSEADNSFSTPEDFFKYLKEKISIFRNDDGEIRRFKETLDKRGIRLVTDENTFRIVVRAQAGQATRVLEAHVVMLDPKAGQNTPNTNAPPGDTNNNGAPPPPQTDTSGAIKHNSDASGFRVTFMRIY